MSKLHELKPQDVDADLIRYKMHSWKNNFWTFFLDCIRTIDESKNCLRDAPAYKYLKIESDVYDRSKVLVINKSRRVFQTHYWTARLLWSFIFKPYSVNIVISINENRAKQLINTRFRPMYRNLPGMVNGLPTTFPWPVLKDKEHIMVSEMRNPVNDAQIVALPSGPEKIRGYTVTNLLIDEFAFQNNCEETMQALKPAIEGDEGRAVIVSTPKFGTVFQDLVTKIDKNSELLDHMTGVTQIRNEIGHTVLSIHYSADPAKRPGTIEGDKWYHRERFGTTVDGEPIPGASGVDTYSWQQEMELSFTVPIGKPVVPEFDKALHCGPYKSCGIYIEDKVLHVGFDFGSHYPAAVYLQADSLNRCVIHGGLMAEDEELEAFMVRVRDDLMQRFPSLGDNFILHADPAGASENSHGTAPPAIRLLQQYFKKTVRYKKSRPTDRARAIRSKFSKRKAETMDVIIAPDCGTHIRPNGDVRHGVMIDALDSGWVYDKPRGAEQYKDDAPKKDGYFEHLMDALGYVFVNVFPTLYEKSVDFRKGDRRRVKPKKRYLHL